MNITMRGLQENVFRQFKAKAVEEDLRLGDAITQAMQLWLKDKGKKAGHRGRLSDLPSWDWGPGTEKSSQEIDKTLYG